MQSVAHEINEEEQEWHQLQEKKGVNQEFLAIFLDCPP